MCISLTECWWFFQVSEGSEACVLEAMKMQNSLIAAKTAKVSYSVLVILSWINRNQVLSIFPALELLPLDCTRHRQLRRSNSSAGKMDQILSRSINHFLRSEISNFKSCLLSIKVLCNPGWIGNNPWNRLISGIACRGSKILSDSPGDLRPEKTVYRLAFFMYIMQKRPMCLSYPTPRLNKEFIAAICNFSLPYS